MSIEQTTPSHTDEEKARGEAREKRWADEERYDRIRGNIMFEIDKALAILAGKLDYNDRLNTFQERLSELYVMVEEIERFK